MIMCYPSIKYLASGTNDTMKYLFRMVAIGMVAGAVIRYLIVCTSNMYGYTIIPQFLMACLNPFLFNGISKFVRN